MSTTFRLAENADAGAIRALVHAVQAEFDLLNQHSDVDSDLTDIESHYMSRGGWFEVIEDGDGVIVGSWGIQHKSTDVCELRKMFLLPQFRGNGMGRNMLQRAIDRARASGYRRIELETATVLERAIRLYLQHGFVEITANSGPSACDRAFVLEL
ncbi:MAG: GNAT family N-acetyltransferase [Planctomycetota bacterium]|jgi:putative acetyltransferase